MKIVITYISLILIALTASTPVLAADKMYKWIDKNGKVHYSDKRPTDNVDTKEISEDLKPVNSSEATRETERLKQVFPKESAAEQAYRQQKEQQQSREKRERLKACERARADLKILRGRVIFVDKNGKRYTISEVERAKRAEELEMLIAKNC